LIWPDAATQVASLSNLNGEVMATVDPTRLSGTCSYQSLGTVVASGSLPDNMHASGAIGWRNLP
jgi:hypothetical protein